MYWSIDYYGSDPEKNNIEWGIAKKSEAWIFCRFKEGLDRKESRGCFWGGLIPQWTLCSFSDFTGIFFITLLRWNGCFIATVAAWGSITHLYPVLYYHQTRRNTNIWANLLYSEKVNLQLPARVSFQGLPLLLGKEKSAKCTYFVTGHCFIHLPLIFSTQRLIISPQHIKLCLWTLCITWCYERSFTEVVSKSLVSQQLRH